MREDRLHSVHFIHCAQLNICSLTIKNRDINPMAGLEYQWNELVSGIFNCADTCRLSLSRKLL